MIDNPLVWFWLLLICGGAAWYRGRSRFGKVMTSIAVIWLSISSSTPVPQWLVVQLENHFTTVDLEQIPDSCLILVLGGGHTVAPRLSAANQLSFDALARVTEALRIYRSSQGAKLVLSGYSSSGRTTQAEVLSLAAVSLGASSSDTLQIRNPGNTRDEVLAFVKRFGSDRPTVLVTSAVHMKRAVAWCEVVGLHVQPAPTGHLMKLDPDVAIYDFIPSAQKLMLMHKCIHEYLGMLALVSAKQFEVPVTIKAIDT